VDSGADARLADPYERRDDIDLAFVDLARARICFEMLRGSRSLAR
jgi:hypothetical protein